MPSFAKYLTRATLLSGLAVSPASFAMGEPGPGGPPAFMELTLRELALADHLAGLHVWLAITPDQEDAWRRFTTAALALPPPAGEIRGMGDDLDVFATVDRANNGVQAFARRFETMREALAALRSELKPDQLGRMNEAYAAIRTLMREKGPPPMRPDFRPPFPPMEPPKP